MSLPPARPIEILLVEDSPSDALLTREALRFAKVVNTLSHVENGVEAIDFLYRRGAYFDAPRPDLILLDLNLPKKDGREVLIEIKNDPDLRAIPVVVLTTSTADEDIASAYGEHANCYISKPVAFEAFAQVVRAIGHFWFAVVTLPAGEPVSA